MNILDQLEQRQIESNSNLKENLNVEIELAKNLGILLEEQKVQRKAQNDVIANMETFRNELKEAFSELQNESQNMTDSCQAMADPFDW